MNFLHTVRFKEAEIDEVVDILSWNGVCEMKEDLIFNAANRWVEYDPENRRQFTERFGITYPNPPLADSQNLYTYRFLITH